MKVEWDRERLAALIAGKVEESQTLEYKASASLGSSDSKKDEITKDVSAFANAAGGTIIYGIAEKPKPDHHLPDRLDPVDCALFSREWLGQIVNQIEPKIDGITIYPVHVGPAVRDFCFVVEVPQSDTAHQARTLRYYKRANFEAVPMRDYEIRDVMNRRKHPKIRVQVKLRPTQFSIKLTNVGSIMARHYMVKLEFPASIDGVPILVGSEKEQMFANEPSGSYWVKKLYGVLQAPLFPGSTEILRVKVMQSAILRGGGEDYPSIDEIRVTVYADDMPPLSLTIAVKDAQAGWV